MSRFTTSLEWLLGRIRLPRVRTTTARSIGMRVLHGLIILSLLAQSSAGIVVRASALEQVPLQTAQSEDRGEEPLSSRPSTSRQSESDVNEHRLSQSDEWHDVFLPLVVRGYPPPPTLIGTGGGEAVTSDGNVRVEFPAGAVAEPVLVYIQTPGATMPPETLSGEPIEIVAQEADSGQPVTQFQAPITVEVAYDETLLHGNENDLSLFYFDEVEEEWLPLPTQVDTEANHLMGLTSHLSVFDFDVQNWEAFRLPSVADFQVASFTGAATYAYSLQLPPGPGGLQPDLTLSYNSQVVDGAHASTQAAWVGMGWSLDTGYIQRNMNGSTDWSGDDTFNLSVAGVSSMLLPGEDGYYHTTDETFWRIKYDAPADTWTVWDKTGTRYLFAHQARYPEYRQNDCNFLKMQTWRWSLAEVRNIFDEVMTYRYAKESKTSRNYCDRRPATTDLAVYPDEIIYPHGRYRIEFVRIGRDDYKQKWATWDQFRIFFQRSLLGEVRVEHDADGNGDFEQMIRRYVFNYEADPGKLIFPNVHWLSPEKPPTPTPTLAQVQEFGLNGNALPTTIFFYDDDMHMTRADNGYGGRLEFEYGVNPWHEIESDSETEEKTYKDGQFVRDELVVTELIQDEYYPGGEYRLATRVKVDNTQRVQLGIDYGDAAVYSDQVYLNTQPVAATFTFTRVLELPATAAEMRPLVKCNRCTVYQYTLTRLLTRHRVVEKRVFDGLDPNPDVFTYRYDEPATNDAAHSEAVANTTEETRYVDAYSEFRGHAMTQEIGPDGRVTTTWFHQDDARKGRASVTSVGTQTFWDSFDELNPLAWTFTHSGTQQLSERFDGDPAFKSTNPNPDWTVQLARQGYSLQDGEAVLVQFRVTTTETQALLAIDSGTPGQPDYRRWGIHARDGAVYVSLHTAAGLKDDRILLSPFKVDAWYVLQMVVDDDHEFVLRVWERNDPALLGWYEDTAGEMPDGRQWRFLQMTWDGTVWLDSYSEGQGYSAAITSYVADPQPTGTLPRTEKDNKEYGDLKIYWTRPVTETALLFEGDGEFTARQTRNQYELGDQGGTQYGNLTRVVEASWGGTWDTGGWVDYRATLTGFYPHVTNDVFLVGLPGFANRYACAEGVCDYSVANLVGSIQYLYDGHTAYNAPPIVGKLTGRRTLLRFAGANQTDPRYSDVTYAYDDWGNLTQTTTYSGEGSALALASGGARTATTGYDGIYHTYALTTINQLGQSLTTAFDYALSVPVAETDANGATTTADYDEFGRLTEIRRPGDETGEATVSITYHDADRPFWINIRQKIDDDTIFNLRRIYNGIGQVIQVQTAGAQLNVGLKDIVVDSVYDAYGRVIQRTVPYPTELHAETPLENGITNRISVSSSGSQATGKSSDPFISADGRYIAFTSQAGNLVFNDTNNTDDVFVHDRWTGHTLRVSVDSKGAQGDGPSSDPSISADGRFVAFKSYARNLVIGDTNNVADVFVHDRQTRQTTRVSVASGGAQGNELSIKPSISADGRYVAFESWARNLVIGDTNNQEDIFVHDRSTGTTTRVSVASDGTQSNNESDVPFISADGRYVVFSSTASNLVVGDNNVTCDTDGDGQYDDNCPDIYVHDRDTGETERVSVASDGSQGNEWSVGVSISADGRYVTFATRSSLASDDTNGLFDIYVRDRQTGQTTRVSVAAGGAQADGESRWPSISADGRYVAFYSSASNLVSGDTNGAEDVFVYDLQRGQISRVSLASNGAQGNGASSSTSISADGRYVAFASLAANLVSGDTNGVDDVFVHDRTPLSGIYLGQQLDQPSTLTDYDILGRPIRVTATDGSEQQFAYSELETVATDAVGRNTRTLLDVWGRTTQVIPPLGPSVSYTYDALDRLVSLEKSGHLTPIAYDLAGRKVEMTDPDMGHWSYTYDAIGNLVTQTDALEKTLWFGYDLLNRLTEKWLNGPGGTLLASYLYDQGTNGIGRRTRMDDLSGNTTWAYDVRGRVVTETKSILNAGAFVTQWGYDSANQVIWMKYPGGNNGEAGEQVNFTYHPQQALNSVISSLGTYVQGTTYDAAGRIIARALGAGVLESNYAYYPWTTPAGQGRLQQMTAGTPAAPASLQDLRYVYDLVGNVTTIEDWRAGSPQKQAYAYDALDRLMSSNVTGGSGGLYSEAYTYDPATGNLASKGGVNYSYLGGKPHAVTHLDGVQRYWYDANGNMIFRQTGVTSETLVHDAENRLTAVAPITAASASGVFVYDGDGNRVKATVNDVTTAYVGNYYEVKGTATRTYYYAGEQRVAMRVQGDPNPANNGMFYLLGDHLGSTAVTANANGAQVAELRYKAFGETRYEWGSTPTTYRYTGQRQETTLGLYYYGARWYDPALGRFVQADTIVPEPGNPRALDRYAYVYNNPLRYTDPTGHRYCDSKYAFPEDCTPPRPDPARLTHRCLDLREGYCGRGRKTAQLYNRVKTARGDFSPVDFMKQILAYEFSPLPRPSEVSPEDRRELQQAGVRWFYMVCGYATPGGGCPQGASPNAPNAIFNWVAAMESARRRFSATDLEQAGNIELAELVVDSILHPPDPEWTKIGTPDDPLSADVPFSWANFEVPASAGLTEGYGGNQYLWRYDNWFLLTVEQAKYFKAHFQMLKIP